ncbi:hypothetical protein RsTz2092_12390 [Deferribacterales bacterium RsTz2092]
MLLLLSTIASLEVYAYDIWETRAHPAPDYIDLRGGADYYIISPTGYQKLADDLQVSAYRISLLSPKRIPLISRLSASLTDNVSANPAPVSNETGSFYGDFFAELRIPGTIHILSYDSSVYLQYRRQLANWAGKELPSDYIYTGKEVLIAGKKLSFCETTNFFAIAIDTPITRKDSLDSYSRFGLYYEDTRRVRTSKLIDNSRYIVNVFEHSAGAFFDISKPVFVDGFVLRSQMSIGYMWRNMPNNRIAVAGGFPENKSILILDFNLEMAYRIDMTSAVNLQFGIGYATGIVNVLSDVTNKNAFVNEPPSVLRGFATLGIVI